MAGALNRITIGNDTFVNLKAISAGTMTKSIPSATTTKVYIPNTTGTIGNMAVRTTIIFPASATGFRMVRVKVENADSSAGYYATYRLSACSNGNTAISTGEIVYVRSDSSVCVEITQNSGSAMNVTVQYACNLIGG